MSSALLFPLLQCVVGGQEAITPYYSKSLPHPPCWEPVVTYTAWISWPSLHDAPSFLKYRGRRVLMTATTSCLIQRQELINNWAKPEKDTLKEIKTLYHTEETEAIRDYSQNRDHDSHNKQLETTVKTETKTVTTGSHTCIIVVNNTVIERDSQERQRVTTGEYRLVTQSQRARMTAEGKSER